MASEISSDDDNMKTIGQRDLDLGFFVVIMNGEFEADSRHDWKPMKLSQNLQIIILIKIKIIIAPYLFIQIVNMNSKVRAMSAK